MPEIRQKLNKISHNSLEYILLALSLITIYGALIYYFYALNWLAIIFILLTSAISFYYLAKYLFPTSPENNTNIKEKISYLGYWPCFMYLFFCALGFYLLFLDRSDRALISPWQALNYSFFIFYGLASLALVFILLKKNISVFIKLLGLSIHYFLSFSVAAIIYKIGYGFDPFIHQATMELIAQKGLVTPKPFYYLGEYGLIVTLHKLSGLSIYLINKFLVPILAALFLPYASYKLLNVNNLKSSAWLTPFFLLALTFSPFIITTPQNLSYLFLILTILFGVTQKNSSWSFILALATLAIHPLTGIPALSWCLIITLSRLREKIKPLLYRSTKIFLFILSALTLPFALFIGGGSNIKEISWNLAFVIDPIKNLFTTLNSAGQDTWLLNFVYFFTYNYSLWLILIIIASLILFYRQKISSDYKTLLFINLALFVAFLVSSQIIFTDLIAYEQTNFANRLLIIILIFFSPFVILALEKLITTILAQNRLLKFIWLTFGLSLVLISLYVSYPRFDRYFNSRGYSTSANDLRAVDLIAQSAHEPYIVLANQQVSVAALKELGFDHYYKTNKGLIYFYPIPTGGELYTYYLDMVYKEPSQETMAQARALAGVNDSYLVINKYWFQSARVISAAKLTADSWQTINNDIYIFKYSK